MSQNNREQAETTPDELIVDSRHRDMVTQVLVGDLKVWQPSTTIADRTEPNEEESVDLGLVLLKKLRLSEEYLDNARERYANEIRALETTSGKPFEPLDVLLYDLRVRFAADHGFVPVMGKNRDAIIGYPQHKGIENPTAIDWNIDITEDGAGHGRLIGIVDTPLAPHDLLPPHMVLRDEEFHPGDELADPWAGHATFVAGLIRRAAPGAMLDVRTGLSAKTGGSSAWRVAKKIASFHDSRIEILNLSLGCVTADNEPPLVLRRALDRLDPGVLVVAAAGNRAQDQVTHIWPAAATAVVAVGATPHPVSESEDLADFSMRERWVDCTAAGVRVVSTYLHGPVQLGSTTEFSGAAEWSGTSFAAATVTGMIAARMTSDQVGARQALRLLTKDRASGITAYVHAEG